MKNPFLSMALAGCVVSMVAGCSSTGGLHDAYVFPRIEGRVIDSNTKLPIDGVIVMRQQRSLEAGLDEYISAGEIQQADPSVYTNDKGEFEMPGKRDLEMGGDRTWVSVTLKFMHAHYHMLSTNYLNRAGAGTEGEPLLQAGDIELHSLPVSSSGR